MKVYLVWTGAYDSAHVDSVHATRESADRRVWDLSPFVVGSTTSMADYDQTYVDEREVAES